MLGFERGGNLFVVDPDTGQERRLTDWEGQHPEWFRINYPKVGDHNPQVRVGVLDVENGETRWLDVDLEEEHYIPRIYWTSDRDGYNHIYRYAYDGELLNQVTQGDWVVTRVEGVDPEALTIYYTSTEESPLERHLYAIAFDGTGRRRVTEARGTHRIDMGPRARFYIDRWSNTETPTRVELWTTDEGGRKLETLEDNQAVREYVSSFAYSNPELFQFTTSDGVTLDGSMIRPPGFDPSSQYPVLLAIYGGPGAQGVYDTWASDGWQQYLAQQGYVVVNVNNRGTGNYGRDFMEIVYGELGRWEAQDFAETARWLASQPWVDGTRMAIHGTSYGGFMTLATMLRHPGIFALGMANSPVTDWRLYDTIYTERCLGPVGGELRRVRANLPRNKVVSSGSSKAPG